MAAADIFAPLRSWERLGLVGLGLLVAGFGVVTLVRSAYLPRRMTDADVYFRAAWAARTGGDIYTIADNNGWTYTYPPTLALLLMPLADPPRGADRAYTLPYAVSVGLWYAISIIFLAVSAHWLAQAVEETAREARLRELRVRHQRWWRHRTWPALCCLIAIGCTAGRGQVNLLLLLLLAGMIRSGARGQSVRAGLWLSSAIVLKVFPAYLLVFPLWRRDWRWCAATAVGLALFFFAVPAALVGTQRALTYDWRFVELMVGPHFGSGGPQEKVDLLERAMDNQSLMAVFHTTWDLAGVRAQHRVAPGATARWLHWVIIAALTFVSLRVATRSAGHVKGGRMPVRASALLICVMLPASPMCHLHYFVLAMPLLTILLADALQEAPAQQWSPTAKLLLGLYALANFLPYLPGLGAARLLGLAMYAGLGLWLVAVVIFARESGVDSRPVARPPARTPPEAAAGRSARTSCQTPYARAAHDRGPREASGSSPVLGHYVTRDHRGTETPDFAAGIEWSIE